MSILNLCVAAMLLCPGEGGYAEGREYYGGCLIDVGHAPGARQAMVMSPDMPIAVGETGVEVSSWLQLVIQGGAMVLLTLIVIRGPLWLNEFVSRLLTVVAEQQKGQTERFFKALDDLRSEAERSLDRTEASFIKRNEILRASLENQTRTLTMELRELRGVVAGRTRRRRAAGGEGEGEVVK